MKTYWDNYYTGLDSEIDGAMAPEIPSQFAAFILQEIKGHATRVVDFGCGNGRDSKFFARHGYQVLGVDGSREVTELCRSNMGPREEFINASVDDQDLPMIVRRIFPDDTLTTTVYARFFIHAIDDATQAVFLKSCLDLIGGDGRAAFEFRTDRDASQSKITPDHFRRFVSSMDFAQAATKIGFKVIYFAEGFGFAKYKNDDAHVARFILEAA